jgi:hypothetical protein
MCLALKRHRRLVNGGMEMCFTRKTADFDITHMWKRVRSGGATELDCYYVIYYVKGRHT